MIPPNGPLPPFPGLLKSYYVTLAEYSCTENNDNLVNNGRVFLYSTIKNNDNLVALLIRTWIRAIVQQGTLLISD